MRRRRTKAVVAANEIENEKNTFYILFQIPSRLAMIDTGKGVKQLNRTERRKEKNEVCRH